MNDLVDTFSRCTRLNDSKSGIADYIDEKNYTKVYSMLTTDLVGITKDVNWHKRVSHLLTQSFSQSEAPWTDNEKEGVSSILSYFVDWTNRSEQSVSSSNVFLCIFYANKRLIRTQGTWEYQLQSKLINFIDTFTLPYSDSSSARFSSFCNTMYAVTWNCMRDNFQTDSTKQKLEMMVASCRWLVCDKTSNSLKVGKKLTGNVSVISVARTDENMDMVIENLVRDILYDYIKTLRRESDEGLICADQINGNESNALVQFTFGCLMVALRSKDFSIATDTLSIFLQRCSEFFNTTFINVLEELVSVAIQFFSEVYKAFDLTTLIETFRVTRTTVLAQLAVSSGTDDLIGTILNSFYQVLTFVPPWYPEKRFENVTLESLATLATEFVTILPDVDLAGRVKLTSRVKVQLGSSLTPEVGLQYISFIVRLLTDKLSQSSFTPKMMLPVERCLKTMDEFIPKLGLVPDYPDPTSHLAHSLLLLSSMLQKAGRYEESLRVSKKCVEIYMSLPKAKLTMPLQYYSNIMTHNYVKVGMYAKGLSWLGNWLFQNRITLDEHVRPFDLFNLPLAHNEWGAQWAKVKFEAKSSQIQQITLYEILHEVHGSDEIMNAALLLELNTYFSCKQVLSDAIVTVGEHLADIGTNACEKALGFVAQAIGFSWDDKDTNEDFCIRACEHALEILNMAAEESNSDDPQMLIVAAVAKTWLSFSYSKRLENVAKLDIDFLQDDYKENSTVALSDKGHEPENDKSLVSGITSLDISLEHEIATLLISAIDCFYTIVSFGELNVKKWFDICPALILLTVRLAAYKISALGESFSAIRAWHTCYVIAKMYDSKYVQFMAGLQLYKLTPLVDSPSIATLEELSNDGIDAAKQFMPPAFFSRVYLARSTVALREKNFAEGIEYLSKVLKYRTEPKSNLDTTFLVMSEAKYLLALYRVAQDSSDFKMENIEPDLAQLTPCALIIQAYKFAMAALRSSASDISGWQDVNFNQHLVMVLFEQMPKALEIFKDSGNIKELMSYGSDMIYISQTFGYISRTIEVLLPLAEADLLARQFETADEKVDAIYKMMISSELAKGIHRVEMNQGKLDGVLNKFGITFPVPCVMPQCTINLAHLESPEARHFKTGPFADPKSPTLISRTMNLPRYLYHSLSCSCYTCLHPKIIPNTIKFFQLLIRVAACGNEPKQGLAIVPVVKVHHIKASVRIMFHLERMIQRLSQGLGTKEVAKELLERVYLPFIFEPGFHLLFTMAEFAPISELEFIIHCVQTLEEGLTLAKETNKYNLLAPFELLYAAVYEHCFANDSNLIRKSDIREALTKIMTTASSN